MKLISLGVVARPHGLSGAFLLARPVGPDSSLSFVKSVYLDKNGVTGPFRVVEAIPLGRGWRVQLEGINSVDAAKRLSGATVQVDRFQIPVGKTNEHMVEDLVGMTVIENGVTVGTMTGVEFTPGGTDRWWIKPINGKEFSIPAVRSYILGVDTESKMIRATNTESLR